MSGNGRRASQKRSRAVIRQILIALLATRRNVTVLQWINPTATGCIAPFTRLINHDWYPEAFSESRANWPLRQIPDIIHFVLNSGWQSPEGLRPLANQCRQVKTDFP